MHDALKTGQIDAVSMLADQLLALEPELQPSEVFLGTKNHSFTERYELLVHRSAGIDDVPGLAGKKLVLQASARTSLAPQWLDTLLACGSLGTAAEVLDTLTKNESPSKAVLQVFFRQADACLVTSNVFELACELNPQLRKELRVLAVSPEVVPSLFFFRPGYTSSVREKLEPAILALHETAAGLQVLTVFQSDGMVKRPLSSLEGTRQLLEEYDRSKQRSGVGSGAATAHTPPPTINRQ
jgi:phosphonate transport system substrate-binding protein